MVNFDQSCAWDLTYYSCLSTKQPWTIIWRKLMEMENYADLMQRLLEIQSGERRRPKADRGRRTINAQSEKKNLAGRPTQKLELSGNSPEQERFKA